MPYGYPQQPQYPQQPMGYPPAQQLPPPQYGYPQQPQPAPQAPPPAPVVSGTIDQFYSQPSAAGGPGVSWKDKPIGASYAGIIAGECKVQQDTDYDSGRPLFQRDQVTPKFVMLIPLRSVQSNVPTPEFPDGEAVFYVRGQARDELVRAMSEAGCSGAPRQGATFQVTLTNRKPNRKGNPSNIVQIVYGPPNGVAHQEINPAPPSPPSTEPPQGQQPVQQPSAGAPSPAPAPQPLQQAPAPQPATQQTPPPLQPLQQVPAPQAPAQPGVQQPGPLQPGPVAAASAGPVPTPGQQPQGLQPPSDLSPEQQQLLAQLTQQQAG